VEQGFATVRDGLIEVDRVQLRRLGSDGPAHPSAAGPRDPAELAVHAAIHVLGPHADDASVCALAGVDAALLAALADRRRIWRRTDGAWGGPAWSDPAGPRRLAPLARSALARFVGDAELPAQVELSAALRWLVLADFGVEETARTCRRWIDAVKVPPADALQVARVLLALGEPGLRGVALEWATCAAVRSLLDEDVRFVRRLLRRWADLGDADHRLLAAREALDGRRFHEADAAFRWDDLPASSVLYGQWVQTGVMIGRELRPDAVDAWLDRFRPSTEDPRHFSWIGAAGLLAYHRGQWTTAVTAFRAALDAERLWGARLGMLSNLAAASLALDEVEEAEAAARRGLSLAVRARDVRREVLLHRQLREARWRRGDGDVVLDRTQAAMLVSPKLGAGHALLDAAILWRHGRLPEAARVASETLAVIRGTTLQPTVGALLLGLVCDASPDLDELQRHACEVAGLAARHPGIVLQVLALAWPRGRVPRLDEAIRRHSHAVPRHQWSSRREILSVDECLARRCVAPLPL
jgi:tetratricopeptide (TPR) repeat protein